MTTNTTGMAVCPPLVNTECDGQMTIARESGNSSQASASGSGSRPPTVAHEVTRDGHLDYLFVEMKAQLITKLRCKNIYVILVNQLKHKTSPFRSNYSDLYQLNDEYWKALFTISFKLTNSTKLRAFHWRTTHGLLYGNKQLSRFGIKDDSNCNFCTTPLQTWQHVMTECSTIHTVWRVLEVEFGDIFNDGITNLGKELGALDEEDDMSLQKNLLLLIARQYIYKCNLEDETPTAAGLLAKIRFFERIEYDIASRKNAVELHFAKWEEILHCLSIGSPN